MRRLLVFILAALPLPLWAQADKMGRADEKKIIAEIYSQQTLETFESLILKDKNLQFRGAQKAEILWLKAYPAPVAGSNRYLAMLLSGKGNEGAAIVFDNGYEVSDYCESLSIWVYGTQLPGILSVMVQDTRKNIHVLTFGRLKFRGWQKLTVVVPDHVVQKRLTINRPAPIKVLKLMYSPGPIDRLKSWQIVYLDHFTARTRKKLLLPAPSQ